MWEFTCDFWASRSLNCRHSSLLQWPCQESWQFGFKSLPVLFKIINPRHLFRTCLQILLAMVNPLNFAFTVHDVYKKKVGGITNQQYKAWYFFSSDVIMSRIRAKLTQGFQYRNFHWKPEQKSANPCFYVNIIMAFLCLLISIDLLLNSWLK